jgi:hypothetical protein
VAVVLGQVVVTCDLLGKVAPWEAVVGTVEVAEVVVLVLVEALDPTSVTVSKRTSRV